MKVFEGKQKIIGQLCTKYKVISLFVFGAAARNELKADSDIDLLVDIEGTDSFEYTDNYFNLLKHLQKVFNQPIDLLETRGLKNPFLKAEIDKTKAAIYG